MEQLVSSLHNLELSTNSKLAITVHQYHPDKGWEILKKIGYERKEKIEVFGIAEPYIALNGIYDSVNHFLEVLDRYPRCNPTQLLSKDGSFSDSTDILDYIHCNSFGPSVIWGPALTVFGQWKYV